jgi:hypothetical protein
MLIVRYSSNRRASRTTVGCGPSIRRRERGRTAARLDQFAERLAGGIDVLEEFEAGRRPSGQASAQRADISVAQRRQPLGRGRDEALAVVVEHDAYIPPGQPLESVDLQPAQGEIGCEQRVATRVSILFPQVEDGDLPPRQQVATDVFSRDLDRRHGKAAPPGWA